MIDLSILKPYIFNMSKADIGITEVDVKSQGVDSVFDLLIRQMDCTAFEGTYRQNQTIDFHYTYEVTKALYVIEHFVEGEEEQEKYAERLLNRHLTNVEYEKIHPPKFVTTANSVFEKDSKSVATKVRRKRTSSEPKEKKITAAEIKKITKLKKFAAVPIKLKLNNDTVQKK